MSLSGPTTDARPAMTFGEVALDLIASIESEFRNAKHRRQWRTSLEQHAAGIWSAPIDSVDTEAVLRVLRPIWTRLPETASRVRGRIERVLDAATVIGLRQGENPARWKGHLQVILPRRRPSQNHHVALPYAALPPFIARLRRQRGLSARVLEFTILTAARSGEALQASWAELQGDVWVIPGARMKAGKEHRVPLVGRAKELVLAQRHAQGDAGGFIFAAGDGARPLSSMAMEMLLRRMRLDATVHGFRSSFRDWAADRTAFPDEVVEEALAHTVGSAVRRAYRRGDALDKRRQLMAAWSDYCGAAACGGPLIDGLPTGLNFSLARPLSLAGPPLLGRPITTTSVRRMV